MRGLVMDEAARCSASSGAAPAIFSSPSLVGRSLRPLQESFLLKKLQVKAHPDLPSGDLMQQQSAGCRAFAFLFCSNFCHWNFSATQEIW